MTASAGESSRASSETSCLAWSRVWSPLVPNEWRREAFELLALPGRWSELEPAFWSTFHVGMPAPRVPLLLHAALGRDGGRAREDWLRVASHLGLVFAEHTLPPDHLAVACELLAAALRAGEDVLVRELCSRYLRPWSDFARARLAADEPALSALAASFAADLAGIADAAERGGCAVSDPVGR